MKDELKTKRCLRKEQADAHTQGRSLVHLKIAQVPWGLTFTTSVFILKDYFNCATYLWFHAHAQYRDLNDKLPTRLALKAGLNIWSQVWGPSFYITGEELLCQYEVSQMAFFHNVNN